MQCQHLNCSVCGVYFSFLPQIFRWPTLVCLFWLASFFTAPLSGQSGGEPTLPGTAPLLWDEDIAARLVSRADGLLSQELQRSVARRAAFWTRNFQSPAAYAASVAGNRQRLARILGVRDQRSDEERMWLVGTVTSPPTVAENQSLRIVAVKWTVFGRIHGEGLLLLPKGREPLADVVAIPDATQTPESLCGLQPGVELDSQYPRRLAEAGCRVLVPWIVDREIRKWNNRAELTTREYLYRSSFELGRHLIGYELQKVLAGIDWFRSTAPQRAARGRRRLGRWRDAGSLCGGVGPTDRCRLRERIFPASRNHLEGTD